MNERLYRSHDDRIIAGVAGGVAERLRMDPSLVRILWLILIPATAGAALALYIVMAFVVPEEPPGDARWAAWDHQAEGYQWPDPSAVGGTTPGAGGAPVASAAPAASDTLSNPVPPTNPAPTWPGASSAGAGPGSSSAAATGSSSAAASMPSAAWVPPPTSPTPSMTSPVSAPPPSSGWAMDPRAARDARRDARRAARSDRRDGSGAILFGLILIVVGGYFFARAYLPDIDANRAWPIILVVLGAVLLVGSFRRGSDRPG